MSRVDQEENYHLLSHASRNAYVSQSVAEINKVNVGLLFAAAFLYDFAVGGAVEILGSFELKSPLSWTATQVPICALLRRPRLGF